MMILKKEQLTWHIVDYIWLEMYQQDRIRIGKCNVAKLINFYRTMHVHDLGVMVIEDFIEWVRGTSNDRLQDIFRS